MRLKLLKQRSDKDILFLEHKSFTRKGGGGTPWLISLVGSVNTAFSTNAIVSQEGNTNPAFKGEGPLTMNEMILWIISCFLDFGREARKFQILVAIAWSTSGRTLDSGKAEIWEN